MASSFLEVLDFLDKEYQTGIVCVPNEFHFLPFHYFFIRSRIPGRTPINNSPKTASGNLPNDLGVHSLGEIIEAFISRAGGSSTENPHEKFPQQDNRCYGGYYKDTYLLSDRQVPNE
jgi:hypothetical protein